MAKRALAYYPDPHLRKIAKHIDDITDNIRTLADDMLETMYTSSGVGLAAPQIGCALRLIVVDCTNEKDNASALVMVNPKIVANSEETNIYQEGCLSIPNHFGDIERPAEVSVEWMDLNGKAQSSTFTELWATCVQHEIDHLNGRLFIDYLGAVKRGMIRQKMKKFKTTMAQ